MKIKLVRLSTILLIVMVTACSSPTAAPTPTPGTTNNETSDPTMVATIAAPNDTTALTPTDVAPPVSPTDTPQALSTTEPVNQPGCRKSAEFVTDVTVPDHTNFKPGDTFVKTWRVKNVGTCIWGGSDQVVYLNGEQMGAPSTMSLSQIAPGEMADISLNMTAPSEDGTYTGYFQLQDASGEKFAALNLWVIISVGRDGAVAVATPVINSGTAVPTTTGSSGSCTYDQNADLVSQMLTLINNARVNNGLPALKQNDKLSASATAHSVDMACNSFISHTGSNGSTSKQRMTAQGYTYSATNEMVFAAAPEFGGDAQAAVDWWLNDADHYPIIMSPKYTEFGGGYAHVASSELGGYFTVDLATPK